MYFNKHMLTLIHYPTKVCWVLTGDPATKELGAPVFSSKPVTVTDKIVNQVFWGQKGLAVLHRPKERVGNQQASNLCPTPATAHESGWLSDPGWEAFCDTDRLEVFQRLIRVPLGRFMLTTAGIWQVSQHWRQVSLTPVVVTALICHPDIISRFVLGLGFPGRFALEREPSWSAWTDDQWEK